MKIHRYFFFLLLLMVGFTQSNGQTQIKDTIYGTLTADKSPYIIVRDLVVPKDSVLIIEAGVKLDFDTGTLIRIDGVIKTMGTAVNPILFTCSDSLVGWFGMYFLDNKNQDTSRFNYTKFEYASPFGKNNYNVVPQIYKGLYLSYRLITAKYSSALIFDNCDFQKNWKIFEVESTFILLKNSNIHDHKSVYGRYKNGSIGRIISSSAFIDKCKFYNNETSISLGEDVSGVDPGMISNCVFENNNGSATSSGGAFSLGNSKLHVKNCIIRSGGLSQDVFINGFNGIIENCSFSNNKENQTIRGTGYNGDAILKNCTFDDGAKISSNCVYVYIYDGSAPLFINCIFRNSTFGISTIRSTSLRVVNCVFQNLLGCISSDDETLVVNCTFINNYNTNTDPKFRHHASGLRSLGGEYIVYNSIFWNNLNGLKNKANLISFGTPGGHKFYNCILDGGMSSLKNDSSTTYVFSGLLQDCDTLAPNFIDTANYNLRMKNLCTGLPFGFNKGYTLPIAMKMGILDYTDILKAIGTDLDGNARQWDTTDIGPYEIQALASRIDITEQPKDTHVCVGNSASFSAKARSLNLSSLWERSTNGVTWINQGISSPINITNLSKADSGNLYRLAFTNACNVNATSTEVTLHVHSPKSINLGKDTSMQQKESITITAGAGFKNYAWSNGKKTESITLNGDNVGLGVHQYYVTVMDAFGCQSSDTIYVTFTENVGITNNVKTAVKIYPNPAKNYLTVDSPKEVKYTIYNTTGLIMQQGTTSNNSPINIASLKPGAYNIAIEMENVVSHAVWMKE